MKMITTYNFYEGMFPRDVLDTIIEGVNKQISRDPITYGELLHWIGLWVMMLPISRDPITYGELLHWIGLWVMMLTVAGSDRRSFWSTCDLDIFECSFFTLSNF